jgi:hypothetical protein
MEISLLFNSSLELGSWINASNTNLTGSLFMTLLLIFLALIMIAELFKLPEFLYLIPLLPVAVIFAVSDTGFRVILGLIAIFLGFAIYSIYPSTK